MSSLRFEVRRPASALLIAGASIIGSVGVTALVASPEAMHVVADPAGCSVNQSQGDHSLSCTPGNASTKGAPSERDLTNENSNVDYGPRR